MKNESYSPKNRKDSLRNLAFLALLTGVLLVLNFTPLGFLKFGPTLSASLLSIPITIGAIVLGPKAGAWLGFVFGVKLHSMLRTGCFRLHAFKHQSFWNFCHLRFGSRARGRLRWFDFPRAFADCQA